MLPIVYEQQDNLASFALPCNHEDLGQASEPERDIGGYLVGRQSLRHFGSCWYSQSEPRCRLSGRSTDV